jgi:hypothetical protein
MEDMMSSVFSRHGGYENYMQSSVRIFEVIDTLEELGIDGRIILQQIRYMM